MTPYADGGCEIGLRIGHPLVLQTGPGNDGRLQFIVAESNMAKHGQTPSPTPQPVWKKKRPEREH